MAESERTVRRRQAEERAERAAAAWKWAGERWPLWAFAGSLAVPEWGTKRTITCMNINSQIAEEGDDVLLFGRLAE